MLRRSALMVLATFLVLSTAGGSPAFALTVIRDEAVFLRALNGSATTYTFDAFAHRQSVTSQLPGVVFSNAMVYDEQHHPSGGAFRTPPNVLMNADWYTGGPIAFSFSPPVKGVGFFNTSIVDGERMMLFDALGDTLFSEELPDSSVTFLGVLSDVLIYSGTIGSRPPSNGTIFIDNFSFGQVDQTTLFTDRSAFLEAVGASARTYTFDEFAHLQPVTNQLPGVTFGNAMVYDEQDHPSRGAFVTPPNVLMNADWYAAGPISFSFSPPVGGVGFFNTSIVDRERVTLFGALGDTLFSGDIFDGIVNFFGFISATPIYSGTVRCRPPTNGTIFIDSFSLGLPALTGVPGVQVATLRLYPNHPNPFNPRTTIRFDLPATGQVRLSVYDVAGRLVRVLVEGERAAGSYEAVWGGRDTTGRAMASGSYLARLEAGGKMQTVRMSLVQ